VAGQAAEIHDHIPHRLVALRRIFLQRLFDHHPQRGRNLLAERLGRLVLHALQHFEIGRSRKRLTPSQHLVENDAKRKDVAARIGVFTA
jgi:hypothetical protein